jgi:hypothetical protein
MSKRCAATRAEAGVQTSEELMASLHPSVKRMAVAMDEKLAARRLRYPPVDGEDNWLTLSLGYIAGHFRREVEELLTEVEAFGATVSDPALLGDRDRALLVLGAILGRIKVEGADVANMAAMLYDRALLETRHVLSGVTPPAGLDSPIRGEE